MIGDALPNAEDPGNVGALDWQRLSAAIHRGDCEAAANHLNAIVAHSPNERELVERGRYAREARA